MELNQLGLKDKDPNVATGHELEIFTRVNSPTENIVYSCGDNLHCKVQPDQFPGLCCQDLELPYKGNNLL